MMCGVLHIAAWSFVFWWLWALRATRDIRQFKGDLEPSKARSEMAVACSWNPFRIVTQSRSDRKLMSYVLLLSYLSIPGYIFLSPVIGISLPSGCGFGVLR